MVEEGPALVFPAFQLSFFSMHRHAKPFLGIYSLRSRAGIRRSCCPSQQCVWKFLLWNFNILTLADRGVLSVLKPIDFLLPQNNEWHFSLAAGNRTFASEELKKERECICLCNDKIQSRVGFRSDKLWFHFFVILLALFSLYQLWPWIASLVLVKWLE